eukprot:m.1853 g.1853  ORF g.1853 m.1853 type:complete len:56 (+) comp2703_c0_seq2:74-241(+)
MVLPASGVAGRCQPSCSLSLSASTLPRPASPILPRPSQTVSILAASHTVPIPGYI